MQAIEPSPPIRWISAARTDTGIVRKLNEDSVLDAPTHRLWCVADGMGGHDSGEVASQLIISTLGDADLPTRLAAAVDVLDAQIQAVNRDLRDRGDSQGKLIGSTVVLVHAMDDLLAILWAGDSRAYLFRDGRCHRLTRDHSQIEELLELHTGSVSENHVQSNAITRAVGAEDTVIVDVDVVQVAVGDWVLLCSDGLGKHVTDAELVGFTADGSPRVMVDKLIETVLARGAVDNVSVVALHAEAAPPTESGEAGPHKSHLTPDSSNYTPENLNALRLAHLRGEIDGELYRQRRRPVLDDIDDSKLAPSLLQAPGTTTKPVAQPHEGDENQAFMQTQIINLSRPVPPKTPAASVPAASSAPPASYPATATAYGWRRFAAAALLLVATGLYFWPEQHSTPPPAAQAIAVRPVVPATAALAALEAFVREPDWAASRLDAAREALLILRQETTPSESATTATHKLRDLVTAQRAQAGTAASPDRVALTELAATLGLDATATTPAATALADSEAVPPDSPPAKPKATASKHLSNPDKAHEPAHQTAAEGTTH